MTFPFVSTQRAAQRWVLVVVGRRGESLSKREKFKARSLPKNAQTPHHPLHAVLGARLHGTSLPTSAMPACEIETLRANRCDEQIAHIMAREQANDQNHF